MRRYAPLAVKRRVRALLSLPEKRRYARAQRALAEELRAADPERPVIFEFVDRRAGGVQGFSAELAQFLFASDVLARLGVKEIVDVGSHRAWIIGVAAGLRVRTVDVRRPAESPANEEFHLGQAESLPFPDDSVECLTSLSSIEHFGLGSYGDDFDPRGDRRAGAEFARVIAPGGHLLLTTLCTGRETSFTVFNTRRVYSLRDIPALFPGLELVESRCFSPKSRDWTSEDRLESGLEPYAWDMYLGLWRKPAGRGREA